MPKMSTDRPVTLYGPTMGTTWTVAIDDPVNALSAQALRAALQAAVDEVDAQMSTWKPDSDLMRLNAAPPETWVALPARLLTVLEAGLAVSRQTGGAFEMNVGHAVQAWGFGAAPLDLGAIRAASAAGIVRAADVLELDLPSGRARKQTPLALDLSGIAKGYGVDRLCETLQAQGLGHALCAIDGEVRALGGSRDGRAWTVGVEMPRDDLSGNGARIVQSVLELTDMAAATSGDYRHFVTVGETRLSHTMDPRRGAPLVGAPASVTVLAPSCMLADAMATALMVMGGGAGAEFAETHGISALIVTRAAGGLSPVGTGTFRAAA